MKTLTGIRAGDCSLVLVLALQLPIGAHVRWPPAPIHYYSETTPAGAAFQAGSDDSPITGLRDSGGAWLSFPKEKSEDVDH